MIALVILIVIILIIPRAHRYYTAKTVFTIDTSLVARGLTADNEIRGEDDDSTADDNYRVKDGKARRYFFFDPNAIGTSEWLKLGLSDKQAAVIEKYKSKGGHFYRPEDIRKIYVLSDEMKDSLLPYVRIASAANEPNQHPAKRNATIDVNTADSTAWESLSGIGPVLAARIIKFRGVLGGFYSISQVSETYGLADSTYQHIKVYLRADTAAITRININTADYEILKRHPYIHAKIAKAILGYRSTNGKFENMEQLGGIKGISITDYQRLRPYLKLND